MLSYSEFLKLAKTTRKNPTKENVLKLVEYYAESGCSTYPVDDEAILTAFPDGKIPGFEFRVYAAMNPAWSSHRIFRA